MLPFVVLATAATLLLVAVLIRSIIGIMRNASLRARLPSLEEPPLALWRKYSAGHDLSSLLLHNEATASARQFRAWRDAFGPLYLLRSMFGEPSLVATSAAAISRVMIIAPSNYCKSRVLHLALADSLGMKGLLLAEGEVHKRGKRVVGPAFHHDALITIADVFFVHARRFADIMRRSAAPGLNKVSDILPRAHFGTFGVIVEACFGRNFVPDSAMVPLATDFLDTLIEQPDEYSRRFALQTIFSFLPHGWFAPKRAQRLEVRNRIRKIVRDVIRENESAENSADRSGRKNLIALICAAREKEEFSEEEVLDNVMSFLIAGQGTTAVAVSWTLYELARNEKWQRRVRAELREWRDACENDEDSTKLTSLTNLEVLDRVIKETIRLHPPVVFTTRVTVVEDEIEGHFVPPGVMVRFPLLAIQTDPETWGDDALSYDPDRWLSDVAVKNKMLYCAFLFGSRGCIGQRFALMEIKAFIASVLLELELSINDADGLPTHRGPFSTPENMHIYVNALSMSGATAS